MPEKTKEKTYYVLDISLREKFLALAYSGSAGGIAGIASKEAISIGLKTLSLGTLFPEFTGTLIGAIAFTHIAKSATETWLQRIPPESLRLRQWRAPKISL